MAFVPAVNTLKAELRYTKEAQQCENVLYFVGSAGVTPTLATTLGNNLIGWWNTNMKTRTAADMTLREVYITDMSNATSFTVSITTGLPSAGTDAGESLPSNVALCVSFRTANRGRSGRGRNYVMGMTEAQTVGSFFGTTYVNAVVAAYQTLAGAGTFTPGLQWVVASFQNGGADRPTALLQPVTTVLSVHNGVDSQRRRLPGRGR